jgi:Rrf2 family transcriptional regulator, cysteine metabolism repressor
MRFSTKGRYGVRAMLDIALNSAEGPVLMRDIAARQGISAQYLEHLISPLIKAGLLRSMRGARGGLFLAKQPEDIILSEVIEILEGSLAPVECVDNPRVCERSSSCVTRDLWQDMKNAALGVLSSVTLRDLMERHQKKVHLNPDVYSI